MLRHFEYRIESVYRTATRTQRKRGKVWYTEAHRFCATLARFHGLPTETIAGVLAALSPVCSWENNLRNVLALVKTGRISGVATYRANIEKAQRILNGETPAQVLGGNKVRNFYASILLQHSDACCIDRHAAALATGRKWGAGQPVTPKQYVVLREAYLRVAKKFRLAPPVLQAITWIVYRDGLNQDEAQYGVNVSLYH